MHPVPSYQSTIRVWLEQAVAAEPRTHVFLRWFENKAWQVRTFADVLARARTLSEWFGAQGLQRGKTTVALVLPNGPTWIEAYLAVTGIGGIIVPMDPKLTAPEMQYILADAEVSLIVTDKAHSAMLGSLQATLPHLKRVLAADNEPQVMPYDTLSQAMASVPNDQSLRFWYDPQYQPQHDDLAAILYTSGTTGKPKGAMLTHSNFLADADGALALISGYVTSEDDFFMMLPLFHAFAFTANFLVALRRHASLSFVRSLRTLNEDLHTLRPTVFMTVPLMIEKVHEKVMDGLKKSFLKRLILRFFPRTVGKKVRAALGQQLRLIIIGGAKADTEVLRSFSRMGIHIVEGYGLTECSPVVSVCHPHKVKVGSIGPAIGGIEVRIDAPNDQGVGELQVRGPIVFRGYLHREEETDACFDGDWFKTGDLASIDSDGYITIRGRAKALIVNREGKNIYPEEVEQAILHEPLIGEVVVLAYQTHGETGEKVGAIVAPNLTLLEKLHPTATPEEVTKLMTDAVKRACVSLAAYKHPRKIKVSLTPLVLTSTQKVRRHVYQGSLDE